MKYLKPIYRIDFILSLCLVIFTSNIDNNKLLSLSSNIESTIYEDAIISQIYLGAYIDAKYKCIEADDCSASNIQLFAVAKSCQSTDNLIWSYTITDEESGQIIQYSYNYLPKPSDGVIGDKNKDVLTNSFEGRVFVLDRLEIGLYKISWSLDINSDNKIFADQYFNIVDNIAPTIDIPSIYTFNALSQGVKAIEVDNGYQNGTLQSYDNCSTELFFTFSNVLPRFDENQTKWAKQYSKYGKYFFDPKTGQISSKIDYEFGKADAWLPNENTSIRTAWCYQFFKNGENNPFKIYVWDKFANNDNCDFNNYSYSDVYFNSPGFDCFPTTIEGKVTFINSDLPKDMTINIETAEEHFEVFTDSLGHYRFSRYLPSTEILISANNNNNYINGITTLDIVLIQKHLLGIKKITNPYLLLAADVNNDGKISVSDILSLRKLIIGSTNNFNNSSWVGVPKELDLTKNNPSNYSINLGEYNTIDFWAVKIGDINKSANLKPRNDEIISFNLEKQEILKNEITSIPFQAKEFKDVYGFQIAIKIDGVNIKSIESDYLKFSSSNIRIENDEILISWNSASAISIPDNEVIFELVLDSDKLQNLQNIISINDRIIAEIYTKENLITSNISLDFRSQNNKNKLYQNEPNPFSEFTSIKIELEQDTDLTISFYDLNSKLLLKQNFHGKKGVNTFNVKKSDLCQKNILKQNTSSILLYNIESAHFNITKKMIFINN